MAYEHCFDAGVRQAGLEIEREKPLPVADFQNDERRVADLVITCDDSRRTTYVDLAVPNPQASRYLPAAGERRGSAAASMRRRKKIKYAGALSSPGVRASALAHRLVPLIIECFGFMDSVGSRWLRELFRERPDRLQSLFTRLSFLLWRMNAALMLEARVLRRA
ncbi:hypothetical protein NDN08_000224 [Rhodosorus marinus]|uniref:Uncharacterized protein n=1 Tax=Rhodosorus marinus TaxID=101924 RepID=A0AAV8UJT2_9RHOD|nr:hypothetical protein NDN08_000224 [Rhodosorus marinus]